MMEQREFESYIDMKRLNEIIKIASMQGALATLAMVTSALKEESLNYVNDHIEKMPEIQNVIAKMFANEIVAQVEEKSRLAMEAYKRKVPYADKDNLEDLR